MIAALAAAKAQPFNGLFYATVATVIPVLYLAIAVQGRLYDNLLQSASRAFARWLQHVRQSPDGSVTWSRAAPAAVAILISTMLALVILAAGILGEVLALLSLSFQREVGANDGVLILTFILVAAAGFGPLASFIRFWLRTLTEATAADDELGRRRLTEQHDDQSAGNTGNPPALPPPEQDTASAG